MTSTAKYDAALAVIRPELLDADASPALKAIFRRAAAKQLDSIMLALGPPELPPSPLALLHAGPVAPAVLPRPVYDELIAAFTADPVLAALADATGPDKTGALLDALISCG